MSEHWPQWSGRGSRLRSTEFGETELVLSWTCSARIPTWVSDSPEEIGAPVDTWIIKQSIENPHSLLGPWGLWCLNLHLASGACLLLWGFPMCLGGKCRVQALSTVASQKGESEQIKYSHAPSHEAPSQPCTLACMVDWQARPEARNSKFVGFNPCCAVCDPRSASCHSFFFGIHICKRGGRVHSW